MPVRKHSDRSNIPSLNTEQSHQRCSRLRQNYIKNSWAKRPDQAKDDYGYKVAGPIVQATPAGERFLLMSNPMLCLRYAHQTMVSCMHSTDFMFDFSLGVRSHPTCW